MQEPKPVSGASAMGAWLSQLILWIKNWHVLSIEGYRAEETSNGRKFKVSSLPFPLPVGTSLSGLNYRGRWVRDNLIGQTFKKGDLVWMDGPDNLGTAKQISRIVCRRGATEADGLNYFFIDGGSGDGYPTLFTMWSWIFICIKDRQQNADIDFVYPSAGQEPPVIFPPDDEFWDLFCNTDNQQAVGNINPVIPG